MPPIHPATCACPGCRPVHPADRIRHPRAATIAGIIIALVITAGMAHFAERVAYGYARCHPARCEGGPQW